MGKKAEKEAGSKKVEAANKKAAQKPFEDRLERKAKKMDTTVTPPSLNETTDQGDVIAEKTAEKVTKNQKALKTMDKQERCAKDSINKAKKSAEEKACKADKKEKLLKCRTGGEQKVVEQEGKESTTKQKKKEIAESKLQASANKRKEKVAKESEERDAKEKTSSEEGKRNEIAQLKEKKEKIDTAKDKARRAQQSEGVAKAKAEAQKKEDIALNRTVNGSVNASVAEKIAQANSDTWANTLKKDKKEVVAAEKCAKSQVEKAKAETE